MDSGPSAIDVDAAKRSELVAALKVGLSGFGLWRVSGGRGRAHV
jgi:hypothetical protein